MLPTPASPPATCASYTCQPSRNMCLPTPESPPATCAADTCQPSRNMCQPHPSPSQHVPPTPESPPCNMCPHLPALPQHVPATSASLLQHAVHTCQPYCNMCCPHLRALL
ncbi:allergen Asp f 7 homolog [Homarus americanus]|uniref:allergen Asp f 7 homolog n=1 Tax=Homarus americanus TaxID=6706 RepID=UPI001C461F48|nr:allergen Asp f 7 homolog [Homarus americanus]